MVDSGRMFLSKCMEWHHTFVLLASKLTKKELFSWATETDCSSFNEEDEAEEEEDDEEEKVNEKLRWWIKKEVEEKK